MLDDITNQLLPAQYKGFEPVAEYVDPNAIDGQPAAQTLFEFDVDSGELNPARSADSAGYSMAARTIWDVDLNDRSLGENDLSSLPNLRRSHVGLLTRKLKETLERSGDIMLVRDLIASFSSSDKPFSSYTAAYFKGRFPLLDSMSV